MAAMIPIEIQQSVLSEALKFNWECSRDAAFIADCLTGLLVEVNPQAERMTGYSRDELVGKHQSMLTPHEEYEASREAFKKAAEGKQRIFDGFHVRCNNRSVIPVTVEVTPAFEVEGRMYIIGFFHDVSPLVEQQQRLQQKRWALDAYAKATHALAQAKSSETLIQETCEAITTDSLFALAWIGIAENEPPFKVNIVGASGKAVGFCKHLDVSWSQDDPTGMGPTGRALRSRSVHTVDDILSDPHYGPWRKRAFSYNLNSKISVPFQLHDGRWAVLSVYSTKWYIFSPLIIEAFTHLGESIAVGLHNLERVEQLELKRWALDAYAKATHTLAQAKSSVSLIQQTCEAITTDSPFALAWVGFAENQAPFKVHISGAAGAAIDYMKDLVISWSEDQITGMGPAGLALRTRTMQVVNDASSDPRCVPCRDQLNEYGLNSVATIPFQLQNDRWAVLAVYATKRHVFSPLVIDAFKHLAESIAVGLHILEQAESLDSERKMKEMVQDELSRTFASVGNAIVKALSLHDPYTAGHQDRVAELSRAIAVEMGLEPEVVEAIGMAAYLHDIGKISTPPELLSKPAKLTEDELKIMRTHVQDGYDILKNVPFHYPIAEIVYQHHERLDGSGYPRGLKDGEIHFGARIIAVADTVESMASARSYRPSMGIEAAINEIESHAGVTLDAQVVRCCLTLFRIKGYTLPKVEQS